MRLCTRVFDALERRPSKASCYRGRVLSLEQSYPYAGYAQRIRVHELEPVARHAVILPEATLLITAEEMALLPEYMALARLLQPALVVIEDADLIARERSQRANACDDVMLNRLLNELDGLRERADVFFVLTTNRPETLEPALASRPGRIDQVIEFPLCY